ncbi:phosphate signaling complex protein PhoU [Saccharopolyspora shandongensis]|uniref:phosphate signaling complex protein PhoU n=1 Tax=Saccharopolyspora shandongensis TaxID=418495 RepID=UPI0033D4CC25
MWLTLNRVREAFHKELAQLGNQLSGMCELAADTMRRATTALLNGDVGLAEQVIEEDATLDRAGKACEGFAQSLLALQTPVASDLRAVLATLYCAVKVERMGGLAVNVAKLVRRNHPARVVPPDLEDQFREMGELDVRMCEHLSELVTGSAEGRFAELNRTDDAVDALHARILETVTGGDWPHGIPAAVNVALLARFYERFADQAVSVARRLEFAATGTLPTRPSFPGSLGFHR